MRIGFHFVAGRKSHLTGSFFYHREKKTKLVRSPLPPGNPSSMFGFVTTSHRKVNEVDKVSRCFGKRDTQDVDDLPLPDDKYLTKLPLANGHTCSMTIVGPNAHFLLHAVQEKQSYDVVVRKSSTFCSCKLPNNTPDSLIHPVQYQSSPTSHKSIPDLSVVPFCRTWAHISSSSNSNT